MRITVREIEVISRRQGVYHTLSHDFPWKNLTYNTCAIFIWMKICPLNCKCQSTQKDFSVSWLIIVLKFTEKFLLLARHFFYHNTESCREKPLLVNEWSREHLVLFSVAVTNWAKVSAFHENPAASYDLPVDWCSGPLPWPGSPYAFFRTPNWISLLLSVSLTGMANSVINPLIYGAFHFLRRSRHGRLSSKQHGQVGRHYQTAFHGRSTTVVRYACHSCTIRKHTYDV